MVRLEMVQNGPPQVNPDGPQTGGTGCSWIATTKSLTGGIGSNVLITIERATQTLKELKGNLETAGHWRSVRVGGISMIQSGESVYSMKSGMQVAVSANFSAQPIGQVQRELTAVTTFVMRRLGN